MRRVYEAGGGERPTAPHSVCPRQLSQRSYVFLTGPFAAGATLHIMSTAAAGLKLYDLGASK